MKQRHIYARRYGRAGANGIRTHRVHDGLIGLGLAGVFVAGQVAQAVPAAAQTPSGASSPVPGRLTVRPHAMATGTRTARAGDQSLDSLEDYLVYVPQQCVGARRCPLVVYLPGGGEEAQPVMERERPRADKYGMILFVPNPVNPGRWDLLVGMIMRDPQMREIPLVNPGYPPEAGDLEFRPDMRGVVGKMPYDPDVRNIDAALHEILQHFAIDPDKIALTGASDGGGYALFLGRNNLDVFSRIIARSTQVHFRGDSTRPRHPATQFLFTGGVGEMKIPLEGQRELEREGHYVKLVGGLRGHSESEEDHDYVWRWLGESWAIPDPAKRPVPPPVADPLPALTTEALQHLSTFWARLRQMPDSIRDTTRVAHLKEVALPLGRTTMSVLLTDVPALAAKYPSVDAALEAAGLTAQQYQSYRAALFSAYITSQVGELAGALEPTSLLGKNVAFIGVHQEEVDALVEAGLLTTP